MDLNYLPYIILLILVSIGWIYLAWYAWQRYFVPGSFFFIAFMIQMVVWSGGTLVVLVTSNPQDKLLGIRIIFAGSLGTPSVLMFLFSQFTRQNWLNKRRYQALFLFEPLVMLLLFFTNPYHHLFISVDYAIQPGLGFSYVGDHYRLFYWLHSLYSVVIYLYCSWALRRDFRISGDFRRKQIQILLVALGILCLSVPLVLLFLIFLFIDITLVFYTAAALVLAWGILRYQLLDLMPVSQRTVLERLEEGVLLLDQHFRIADINNFMKVMINQEKTTLIGRSLQDVLPVLYQKVISAQEDRRTRVEYVIEEGINRGYYEMHLVTLDAQRGRPSGYLLTLSDISERKLVEIALRRRLAIEELLADLSKNFISFHPQQINLEIEQAVARISKFLGGEVGLFYLFQSRNGLIHENYSWKEEGDSFELQRKLELPVEFIVWLRSMLEKGESIRIGQRSSFPRNAQTIKVLEKTDYESVLVAPMFVGQELIAAMIVATSKRNAWNEESSRFLRLAGDILVNAVVRTQTDESLQQSTRRLKCLRSIDQVILSSNSMDEIAILALRTMQQLVPFRQAGIVLVDQVSGGLKHVVSIADNGESVPPIQSLLQICPDELGRVQKGLVSFVDDLLGVKQRLEIEDYLLGAGFVSYISVPMMVQGEFAGLMCVTADRPGVFTQEHIEIAGEIGNLMAVGLYNARLVSDQREALLREEKLNEITRVINSSFEIEAVIDYVLQRSAELIHADVGLFCQYPMSEIAMHASTCNFPLEIPQEVLVNVASDPFYQWFFETGESIIYNELDPDAFSSPFWTWMIRAGIGRFLVVPVRATGQVVGLIGLLKSVGSNSYDQRDLYLLESLGMQAGVAIQNARSFQEEHNRVMELEALRNTVTDILTEQDLQVLLRSIVERAVSLLKATGGELSLYEEGNDFLEVVVCIGLGQDYSGTKIAVGEGGFGRIAVTHQPITVYDYQNWEGRSNKYVYSPSVSFVGVPLIAMGRFLGGLGVGSSDLHRRFTEEDIRLLTLFGQQAAIAIEKAMIYEEARKRAREAETLREASAAVAASLQLEDTIMEIMQQLRKVVQHDSSSVMLLKGDAMEVVGGYGFHDKSKIIGLRFNVFENTTARVVYLDKKPLIIDDVSKYSDYITIQEEPVRSWMGVPLIIHGRVSGMLTLDSIETNHFTEEHARLGIAFAGQVAVALENARLFDEIQQLAITDPLTDLFNRRYFMKVGNSEFERALRYRRNLAMVMLDIDFFKRINDTYGHSSGDHVLVGLAERCKKNLRDSDVLCRYGGEEFVILLPETEMENAYELAERIRLDVAETPIVVENEVFSITISLGVADIRSSDCTSIEEFIDCVDGALYQAKQGGRNLSCKWDKGFRMGLHTKVSGFH